jgi:DNA invertase Pin-like site-specific DNA recombinase
MGIDSRKPSPLGGTSRKITAWHLERWALVYVRQSTVQQMVNNQESTRMQYALRERAEALGWERERIAVIDDDLGRSGASAEGRPGFQRLVAEVGLNHVGVILGVEMSRFARSCRDWYQLLEICGLFGTLIADLDGLYDPSDYNDRLLLGLKGTMSEAELHVLKQRMYNGKLAKAQRGELGMPVPMGYAHRPSGEVVKDPDERARAIIEEVFRQFRCQGSALGVVRFFLAHELKLPVRERVGPQKGELTWHEPNRGSIGLILKNPIYAGAYVLGRRPVNRRKQIPGHARTWRPVTPVGEWGVFLQDRVPAYLSWNDYLLNQERLKANGPREKGIARNGTSLLAGLIVCGRCGHHMASIYARSYSSYRCMYEHSHHGGATCQCLTAEGVDRAVERQVLAALQPAAMEISLAVAANVEAERGREDTLWRQRVERAKFEADRARRQYDVVEPENRLVARTLERAWEETLHALREIEEAFERHQRQAPVALTEAERNRIRKVAEDLPGLWNAETTTPADRKAIVRELIDQVVVLVVGESERVQITTHWAGGYQTEMETRRPVRSLAQLTYLPSLLDRVQSLREAGATEREIAQTLNQEGWRPAKRAERFTEDMIGNLLDFRRLRRRENNPSPRWVDLGTDEWTVDGLSKAVGMPAHTLYWWIYQNQVAARLTEGPKRRWILRADEAEIKRLRELHRSRGGVDPRQDAAGNSQEKEAPF